MRKILISLLALLATGAGMHAQPQRNVEVSPPRIDLQDHVIHICYDILNSSPSDSFTIRLEVTDDEGRPIRARALEGDFGEDVPGGYNKLITWDLEKDGIYLNTQIFFEIYATYVLPPPPPSVVESQSRIEAKPENTAAEQSPVAGGRTYSRTGLMLQSLAFPGLGLTRITDKPHWIRGAVGYGCIAGSVIFNLKARNTYQSIDDFPDFEDKMELFDTSVKEDKLSDVLGFAAIGIWITDFFWTRAGTKYLKSTSMRGGSKGISVDPSLDPVTCVPTLTFTYRF